MAMSLLTRLHEKARSSVLAPAPFVLTGTLRPLFAIAQDGDAARGNALGDQMIHGGLRPPLPEVHVELGLVSRGPLIVAVSLDQDEVVWIGAKPGCVLLEDLHVARPDHRLAEVEVYVPQLRDRLVVPHSRQANGSLWSPGLSKSRATPHEDRGRGEDCNRDDSHGIAV